MAKRRKRRSPGSGYAQPADNKTWIAFFPKLGGGYHVRRGFDTRAAAEAWLDSLLKQQADKVDVASGQMRLDLWMDRWKERSARDRQWKAKMLADVEFKLGYVKPFLGASPLADVLPDHVDSMIDTLSNDLAENTVRQIRNYLYQVFQSAVARRYITYNPVIKPERRKRARQKEPERLSAPQAALLIRAAASSFYALAWWLVVTLGMRAGEICGLRWGDVDMERCTIFIQIQQTDVKGKVTQDLPKNDKTRKIAFSRALAPMFETHKRAVIRRAAQGLHRGYWQEHGLVFPGRGGRPMNPIALRHQLKRLTDTCKLPPVTTHNLRHTAAKFYTDINTPHDVKQAILGHTPDITGHYGPPDPDAQRPWVERVYQMVAGEVGQLAEQTA